MSKMSPFIDPEELKKILPSLEKLEIESLLASIYDRLKIKLDSSRQQRLYENKEILEKALEVYFC